MENDAAIKPFIVETTGAYGHDASEFIDDIVYLAQTSAVAYAPADIRNDLMDSIAIAVQVGNALAIRRSREMSLLDRRRRYQMSVAQALINRHHQPIPPWSSLDNATSDSQPSQAMISPQRVIEVDVISSTQPDHSTFALPEDDEMIVDGDMDVDGGAVIDLSALGRRASSVSSVATTVARCSA